MGAFLYCGNTAAASGTRAAGLIDCTGRALASPPAVTELPGELGHTAFCLQGLHIIECLGKQQELHDEALQKPPTFYPWWQWVEVSLLVGDTLLYSVCGLRSWKKDVLCMKNEILALDSSAGMGWPQEAGRRRTFASRQGDFRITGWSKLLKAQGSQGQGARSQGEKEGPC